MTLIHELSESSPQHLGETSNVLEEVTMIDGSISEDDQRDDVDEVEE